MKSWRERKLFSAPVVLAVCALLAACSIVAWSLYAHRGDMQFNLLAEAAGVLFEVSLVILVVDWLVQRRERQRWRHAYPMISDRLATAFVDTMRLLYVATVRTAGYAADLERYPAFYGRLTKNLDHARSTLEGFAIALDSSAHYAARDIELKLRWLHSQLERPSATMEREFRIALECAEEFDQFCAETWRRDYEQLRSSVLAVIRKVAPEVTESMASLERAVALNLRYRLQDSVLDEVFVSSRPLGAFHDHRQETSMHYFVIDWILLRLHASADAR